MIITRSPLRISLGGGGTDLPSYYRRFGGALVAAAIDKYVYIILHDTFLEEIVLKYSSLERVRSIEEVRHPIIREALREVPPPRTHLEIASMADIPAGTGLGSSGSFTTALLKALHALRRNVIPPGELAEQACRLEMERLKEPSGKQDPYIAAFGGVTCFTFPPEGPVEAQPLAAGRETLDNLEDNLLLFYTGQTRASATLLQDQESRTRADDPRMLENLHFIKELGLRSREALEQGDLVRFAETMNEHWEWKRKRFAGMSNERINAAYELARSNGARGGKLIGAGGGGFLLFFAEDKVRLRHALRGAGFEEVRFRFDFLGTEVLVQS